MPACRLFRLAAQADLGDVDLLPRRAGLPGWCARGRGAQDDAGGDLERRGIGIAFAFALSLAVLGTLAAAVFGTLFAALAAALFVALVGTLFVSLFATAFLGAFFAIA